MPGDADEEVIEVCQGVATEYGELSGSRSAGAAEKPQTFFDEKQRNVRKQRQYSGPPPQEDDSPTEAPDVPPTVPAPLPLARKEK